MESQHVAVIHFVDMISGQNHYILGVVKPDKIDILINRIGGSGVPIITKAFLSGNAFDKLIKFRTQQLPPPHYMTNQRL